MTYLLTQMMLYMLCALILGLILGWLIWGRLAERLRRAEADRADLSAKLRATGDGSELRGRLERANADLDECRKQRHLQDEEIARLQRELSAAQSAADAASVPAASAAVAVPAAAVATGESTKPKTLTAARNGSPDDLKLIKGVGPKMERMLHGMGFFHYDQIAAWSQSELAWVDDNLEGFKGRASRDEWIPQAKILASGGETEFSKRNA